MVSELPLDILINVLWHLPPIRSRGDSSAATLAACLRVSSLFAEAARRPSLWKAHYEMRFEHHNELAEASRLKRYGDDWRLLYVERRRLDRIVQRDLNGIVFDNIERRRLSPDVVAFGMDIWDVLDLEQFCPLPLIQRNLFPNATNADGGTIPEYALPRRYWAKYLLECVSRRSAVLLWRRFWDMNASEPTFEETMTHLSCFFGHSPKRITAQLQDLANRCRTWILGKSIALDPAGSSTHLVLLCEEIVKFMRIEGFQLPGGRSYYALENKFPHLYLNTHKQTIPMSLVHIFVAIATRLGIESAPINFPGTVLAHVRHPKSSEGARPIVVNPAAEGDSKVAADLNVTDASHAGIHVLQNPIPTNPDEENFSPAGGMSMLFRSVNNIRASIMASQDISEDLRYSTWLLVLQIYMLFQFGEANIRAILSGLEIEPLDAIYLIEDVLPALAPWIQDLLRNHCDKVLVEDLIHLHHIAPRRSDKRVQYFVGMPVASVKDQRGIIRSWRMMQLSGDPSEDDDDSVEREMVAYDVITFIGTVFTATDICQIRPIDVTQEECNNLFRNFPQAARFFTHVEWANDGTDIIEGGRRGRLVGSPETQARFPEDDAAGRGWIATGQFRL